MTRDPQLQASTTSFVGMREPRCSVAPRLATKGMRVAAANQEQRAAHGVTLEPNGIGGGPGAE